MSRGSLAICWAMALLVALAPLPFGSVRPLPSAALQVSVLAVALVWIAMRRRQGLSPLPWSDPLAIGGGALLAYGLIQIVPLPAGIVRLLSPAAAALKAAYSPVPGDWTALSINSYETWRSCLWVACWTLAALLVRHNAMSSRGRLIVGGGVAAGGLFQAGYGLFEFISGRQHIFGYAKKYFTDVATGTFISRNNYAGYLEMALPVVVALAIVSLGGSAGRAAPAGAGARGAGLKKRLAAATGQESFRTVLLLMGAILIATAMLMSRSRGAVISMALALLAGAVALAGTRRARGFAAASAAVVVVVVLFASQIDILPLLQRFEGLQHEFGGGYGRKRVWMQAMPMLAAYPLTGSGLGTWELAFSPYRDDRAQVKVDFAHNDYLEFAAEAGLVGLTVFAAAAALALRRRAVERRLTGGPNEIALGAGVGLAAFALHSFTDFHLSIPADALAASVLAGLFLGSPQPLRSRLVEALPRAGDRAPAAWGPSLAAAAALLVMALAAASPAVAQMRVSGPLVSPNDDLLNVDSGAPAPDAAGPEDVLCAGCVAEPYNAARYIDAASRARKRLLKDVEALMSAQANGADLDPATRLYLAGRIEEALALARRGLELSPASGRGHLEAGLLLFGRFVLSGLPPQASQDLDQAVTQFDMALELQPWRAASHRKVARVMAPLYELCSEDQRGFIARVTKRANQIDPRATDIREALIRMGV